uniref:Putative secreted protein n=1 Tax=Ixodes ricinus TaxID=34613 RepID=A0A147BEV4_IXORI
MQLAMRGRRAPIALVVLPLRWKADGAASPEPSGCVQATSPPAWSGPPGDRVQPGWDASPSGVRATTLAHEDDVTAAAGAATCRWGRQPCCCCCCCWHWRQPRPLHAPQPSSSESELMVMTLTAGLGVSLITMVPCSLPLAGRAPCCLEASHLGLSFTRFLTGDRCCWLVLGAATGGCHCCTTGSSSRYELRLVLECLRVGCCCVCCCCCCGGCLATTWAHGCARGITRSGSSAARSSTRERPQGSSASRPAARAGPCQGTSIWRPPAQADGPGWVSSTWRPFCSNTETGTYCCSCRGGWAAATTTCLAGEPRAEGGHSSRPCCCWGCGACGCARA